MGLLADGFARTLAYVTRRDPPQYSAPQARPADANSANTDDGVRNVRKYVAEGSPARTRPVSGSAAGSVPAPDGRLRGTGRPASDFSKGPDFDRVGPPRTGVGEMKYGLQPDAAPQVRPGASMSQRPAPLGSGPSEDGQ